MRPVREALRDRQARPVRQDPRGRRAMPPVDDGALVAYGIHGRPEYAMQAAVEGAGVVLGWRSLAQADLDAGRLIIPFDLPLQMDVAFYLVYPEASAEQPKLVRFCEWLLGQTMTSPGTHPHRRRRR